MLIRRADRPKERRLLMVNAKQIAALSLAVGVLAVVVAAQERTARQKTTAGLTKSLSLTAMDYIEIQQLLARYGFALDTVPTTGTCTPTSTRRTACSADRKAAKSLRRSREAGAGVR